MSELSCFLLPGWAALDFFSPWPFFLCLVALYLLASTPVFRLADLLPGSQHRRVATLDGLRGVLALAVVFHHCAIYHVYRLTGAWSSPRSRFYGNLGPLGVSLFFMITGYLFWGKLLRARGKDAWFNFFVGRVFRLGPLYLVAVGGMLLIIFALQSFSLHEPSKRVFHEICRWGLFGILPPTEVNGYRDTVLWLGVAWSIQWEWFYYASLPLLAFAARSSRFHLPLVVAALAGCLLLSRHLGSANLVILFLFGMLTASLQFMYRAPLLPDRAASAGVLLLLAGYVAFPMAYRPSGDLLLGIAFYLIASGATLFGLLTSRPARRLGDVSYGIYLLQQLVLGLAFTSPILPGALRSPLLYWLLSLGAAAVLVLVATLTHVWVERPGITLGKKFMRLTRSAAARFNAGP